MGSGYDESSIVVGMRCDGLGYVWYGVGVVIWYDMVNDMVNGIEYVMLCYVMLCYVMLCYVMV